MYIASCHFKIFLSCYIYKMFSPIEYLIRMKLNWCHDWFNLRYLMYSSILGIVNLLAESVVQQKRSRHGTAYFRNIFPDVGVIVQIFDHDSFDYIVNNSYSYTERNRIYTVCSFLASINICIILSKKFKPSYTQRQLL